jgi:hypothetical protein
MALASAALASDNVGYVLATVCTRQPANGPSEQRVPPADAGEAPREHSGPHGPESFYTRIPFTASVCCDGQIPPQSTHQHAPPSG